MNEVYEALQDKEKMKQMVSRLRSLEGLGFPRAPSLRPRRLRPLRHSNPAWRRRDNIAMSWIFGTTSLDLQDIVRTPDATAREVWLALETQLLGNTKTRALQLDIELRMLEHPWASIAGR